MRQRPGLVSSLKRALRTALAAALFLTNAAPGFAAMKSAPRGTGRVPAVRLTSPALGGGVRIGTPGLKGSPDLKAADPKVAAFLERARQDAPSGKSAAPSSPDLMARLSQALSSYKMEDIQKMPLAEMNVLAGKLFDKSGTHASSSLPDGTPSGPQSSKKAAPLKRSSKTASPEAAPQAPAAEKPYVRNAIAASRFGDGERRKSLSIAYQVKERIDKAIIGEGQASKVLQDRVVQYIEGLGTRTKDPVALHMIGLPGIGKSAMLDVLETSGFPILRIDAQKYAGAKGGDMAADIREALEDYLSEEKNKGRPLILAIEELDKLPENGGKAAALGMERTNSVIGALNQILTEGKLPGRYPGEAPLDLSNIMVLTTMNFAPTEIERFSKEALKQDKSYYDFTVEDFAKFDAWIRAEKSATYKILSRLFRPNTVSRLAPNTIILKPLSSADYRVIARQVAEATVQRNTESAVAAGKRLKVTLTERFIDFLAGATAYAPSGARETVYRADALTEQLIAYGTKAVAKGDDSLDRPRTLVLDFDPAAGAAVVEVTPHIRRGRQWAEGAAFKFSVAYEPGTRTLIQPDNIATAAPAPVARRAEEAQKKEKPVTKKQVLAVRFPKTQNAARGLAEKIDEKLVGQKASTKLVEREMNVYLGRSGPASKEPTTAIFAGFPGIGKSELINQTARILGLPVVRINMQAFSSEDSKVVENFMDTLVSGIEKAQDVKGPWQGKYILLIEELDKVYEIDQKGNQVNRPVMAIIKDLLNDGQASVSMTDSYTKTRKVDVRDAFLATTMNFSVDRFGFMADPRQTSIKDVYGAWEALNNRLADKKSVMGSMFLPETVSRLMSRLHIMAPLLEADYRKVIELQAEAVNSERLHDKAGRNTGLIEVKLTPAYKKYLFSETVIPSEGPRHTSVASRGRISGDVESALKGLSKSSDYAARPITITLDYKPGASTVTGTVTSRELKDDKPVEVFRQTVPLFFPPLNARGRMEPRRLKTAVHEFGHAYTGVRLGLRFEYATVIPPQEGTGGYVKFNDESQSAKAMLSHVYAALGSRAMERIFLSAEPLKGASVLDITAGPSQDIKAATMELYNMLHELGFDPEGGTMDRLGVINGSPYANFESLPSDTVEKLGRVLRKMEDQVIADLLAANPREWYVGKITEFARAGGVEEKEFYGILGYPHPGETGVNVGESSLLYEHFKDAIKPASSQNKAARAFKQGLSRKTAAENLEAYQQRFVEILKEASLPR